MFSRYTIIASREELAGRFSVDVPEAYQPQYNAAPTHLVPLITQDSQGGISFFYWGAPPSWANKKPLAEKIINTRLESIPEKTVTRKKLKEKRCLIPADGFYGWKHAGKRTNIPYRFTMKDKSIFALAGLWEEYENEEGETFHTFSVITAPSNDDVAVISERMPVILNPEQERRWLNTNDDQELLSVIKAASPKLDHYSVSPRVNSPDRNDKFVIMPAPPSDEFGNLTLFD